LTRFVLCVWLQSEVGPIWPLFKFDRRRQQSHTRTTTIQFVATSHKGAVLPWVGASLLGAVTSHESIIYRRATKVLTSLPAAVTSWDGLVCCRGPKVLTSLLVAVTLQKACLPPSHQGLGRHCLAQLRRKIAVVAAVIIDFVKQMEFRRTKVFDVTANRSHVGEGFIPHNGSKVCDVAANRSHVGKGLFPIEEPRFLMSLRIAVTSVSRGPPCSVFSPVARRNLT
jgi:hypothetical protein